jgi:hypothetical protein
MIQVFINDDKGYLRWAARNPNGFIVNADNDFVSLVYPMVHHASHKALTTPKNQNYTTRRFFWWFRNLPAGGGFATRRQRLALSERQLEG